MFLVIAAIVGGLFAWLSPKAPQGASATLSGNQDQGPVTVAGTARDITINYNIPATETKAAIDALEKKLNSANNDIQLTKGEVKLLALALRDLDQRTSAISKLPDGRTMLGGYIGGEPRIVIQEHQAAVKAFNEKDLSKALTHSKNAIEAYEATKKIPHAVSTNDFVPEFLGKLYYFGSILEAHDKQYGTALAWIKNAEAADPHPAYKAFQAAIFYDMGKPDEAKPLLDEALKASPDDQYILEIKQRSEALTPK